MANTHGSATAASYGVSALNMGGPPNFPNQDQLVYQKVSVPEGSGDTLLLLGLAVGGLVILKRKFA
jgi:hypothetical protein